MPDRPFSLNPNIPTIDNPPVPDPQAELMRGILDGDVRGRWRLMEIVARDIANAEREARRARRDYFTMTEIPAPIFDEEL